MTVFGSRKVFDGRILLKFLLQNVSHARVCQITPKLILYTKIDIYPHINCMNK